MFANNQPGGIDASFPDVCLTPVGAVLVPVPYPNAANGSIGIPAAYAVLFGAAPAHNLSTVVPLTTGDVPGVQGVSSGVVMGPSRHTTASFTCLVAGMPATRMTSSTLQNATNCVGARVTPSQLKVLLLAP